MLCCHMKWNFEVHLLHSDKALLLKLHVCACVYMHAFMHPLYYGAASWPDLCVSTRDLCVGTRLYECYAHIGAHLQP